MADQTIPYTPVPVSIPPVPQDQLFSELQWTTLLSIASTVVPKIRSRAGSRASSDKQVSKAVYDQALASLTAKIHDPDAGVIAAQYLAEDVSTNVAFRENIQRLFTTYVHQEGRNGISLILNALNTKAGSLILTGSMTPFQNQPFGVRENIFRGWETSRLKPLRAVFRALSAISRRTWIVTSPTALQVIGFPQVPAHGQQRDGHPYEFLGFPGGDRPEIIETDVVVVGSGCGGGVAAKNLSEAGHKVIVVEKAYQYSSRNFPMNFDNGFVSMFEGSGAVTTDDGTMGVFAGSVWGGGGTVNWAASLQTQGYVRQEWADGGLPFFTSMEFQNSLDRVCERIGASSEYTRHNHQNRVLLEGARKLGYSARAVPQNTGTHEHYCGHCTMGCYAAEKQGPTETYLADASKAGAQFIEGFHVDRVLFTNTKAGRVASGVEGTWTSRDAWCGQSGPTAIKRKIIIKSKKVIVSCGTLQSPLLLLRSGIKNPQVGRNLHLHPVVIGGAVFDEETRPWEGAALTTVIDEFEDLDGHGHGVKVECLTMLPPAFLPAFTWRDGLDWKMWTARLSHMAGFITLTKDRDTGRVYPDPADGRLRIDYTPSAFDRKHIVEGIVTAAKVAYVAGAKEFRTSYRDMPPFIRPDPASTDAAEGTNNAALQAWISELRRKTPCDPERTMFASAHQMGTCRMGSSARSSVVDPECQVWGTRGLYVMDASVFPSASGVNPMVTNMGIADWASQKLAKSLDKQMSKTRL